MAGTGGSKAGRTEPKLGAALVIHVKSPGSVTFEGDDEERIQRAQVALLLHITPEAVDAMSVWDMNDVLSVARANEEIAAWRQNQRRKRR